MVMTEGYKDYYMYSNNTHSCYKIFALDTKIYIIYENCTSMHVVDDINQCAKKQNNILQCFHQSIITNAVQSIQRF
jgi:hypothetical protein